MECQPNWTTDHIHAFNERIIAKKSRNLAICAKTYHNSVISNFAKMNYGAQLEQSYAKNTEINC